MARRRRPPHIPRRPQRIPRMVAHPPRLPEPRTRRRYPRRPPQATDPRNLRRQTRRLLRDPLQPHGRQTERPQTLSRNEDRPAPRADGPQELRPARTRTPAPERQIRIQRRQVLPRPSAEPPHHRRRPLPRPQRQTPGHPPKTLRTTAGRSKAEIMKAESRNKKIAK